MTKFNSTIIVRKYGTFSRVTLKNSISLVTIIVVVTGGKQSAQLFETNGGRLGGKGLNSMPTGMYSGLLRTGIEDGEMSTTP